MDRRVYDNMRATEHAHWWFRARRKILSDQISLLKLPLSASILEVGCGTGGNLEMLSHFGSVVGVEPDPESRAYAAENSGRAVLAGKLPDGLPIFDEKFDLIAALDVIEHLDDDTNSVAALRNLLKPGGIFLTTVPAHPWLWSRHDELHHHKRRYRKAEYTALIRDAGFEIEKASYFNSVLFPVIAFMRALHFGAVFERPDDAMPSRLLNSLLERAFASEAFLLRHTALPFGVSLLVVARAKS